MFRRCSASKATGKRVVRMSRGLDRDHTHHVLLIEFLLNLLSNVLQDTGAVSGREGGAVCAFSALLSVLLKAFTAIVSAYFTCIHEPASEAIRAAG